MQVRFGMHQSCVTCVQGDQQRPRAEVSDNAGRDSQQQYQKQALTNYPLNLSR